MDSQGSDMFASVYRFLLTISSRCRSKNLKTISVSFFQIQRRSDRGGHSGSVGPRSGADYKPNTDRYSGELVRGRRQRWVSPE